METSVSTILRSRGTLVTCATTLTRFFELCDAGRGADYAKTVREAAAREEAPAHRLARRVWSLSRSKLGAVPGE